MLVNLRTALKARTLSLFMDMVLLLKVHYVKSVQIRSFFWSVFSGIRTEYEDLLRKSPYSVRMRENTDHKKLLIWTLFTQWLPPLQRYFLP